MFNPNAIGVGAYESLTFIVAHADGVAVKQLCGHGVSRLTDH
jgi:hypothetical protein